MKIRWLKKVNIEVIYGVDNGEIVDSDIETVIPGEVDDIDIFNKSKKHNTIDVQFSNGGVACGISKTWYEVIDDEA